MEFLIETLSNVTWQHAVMWLIGGILIFLAIKKEMEPALLLPIGFGAILVNIPFSNTLTNTSYVCESCKQTFEQLVETCTVRRQGRRKHGSRYNRVALRNRNRSLRSPAYPVIYRYRRDDRLRTVNRQPETYDSGRVRSTWNLSDDYTRRSLRIQYIRRRFGRYNRRGRSSDFYTRRKNARQRLSRSDSSRGVLVYGARSDYTTCRNQVHYEQKERLIRTEYKGKKVSKSSKFSFR